MKSEEPRDVIEQVEIRIKYEGYIEKEQAMADKMKKFEDLRIPDDLELDKLASLEFRGQTKTRRAQT